MRMSIKAEKIYIFLINNSTNTLILNLLNPLRKLYIYKAEVKIFKWLYMGDNIHKNYFYDILFKKPWECQLPRF